MNENDDPITRLKLQHQKFSNSTENPSSTIFEKKLENSYVIKKKKKYKFNELRIPSLVKKSKGLDKAINTTSKSNIPNFFKKKKKIKIQNNSPNKSKDLLEEKKDYSPSKIVGCLMRKNDVAMESNEYDNSKETTKNNAKKNFSISIIMSNEFSDLEKNEISKNEKINELTNQGIYLPLECFDDEENELYPPKEWVEINKSNDFKIPIARSKFFDGKEYVMEKCVILDYDEKEKEFLIKWDRTKGLKKVKRLNLIFDKEDEKKFIERINKAIIRRKDTEKRIRYLLQVEKIKDEEVTNIDQKQLDKIINLIGKEISINYLNLISDSINEIKENHKKSIKKSIFDYLVKDPTRYKKFDFLDISRSSNKKNVPKIGTIQIPKSKSFTKKVNELSKILLINNPIYNVVFIKINDEWKKMNEKIIKREFSKPIKVQDFYSLQINSLNNFILKLKNDFIGNIVSIIRDDLFSIYNFYSDNFEHFNQHPIKIFTKRVNLILSSQLRKKIEDEILDFEHFFSGYDLKINSFNLNDALFGFRPIFTIKIIEKEGSFVYDSELDEIFSIIKNLYEKIIKESNNIDEINKELFSMMSFENKKLNCINLEDSLAKECWKKIEEILKRNFEKPKKLIEVYKKYESFFRIDIKKSARDFVIKEPQESEINKKLIELYNTSDQVQNESLDEVNFELLNVNCENIKKKIRDRTLGFAFEILSILSEKSSKSNNNIIKKFEEMNSKIQITPNNPEELNELKKYIGDCYVEIGKISKEFEKIKYEMSILDQNKFIVSDEIFQNYVTAYSLPKKFLKKINDVNIRLEECKRKLLQELSDNIIELQKSLDELTKEVSEFSNFNDSEKVEQYYERVMLMKKKIEASEQQAKLFNSRELMFNLPKTEFSELKQISKDFSPMHDLWVIAYQESQQYPEWVMGLFKNLNPEEIRNSVMNWTKNLAKLSNTIQDSGPKNISQKLYTKLNEFKKNLPLIDSLRNEGLKERHWKKISELINVKISLNDTYNSLTLSDLTSNVLVFKNLENITTISDYASKEWTIECNLEKMNDEWKDVKFELQQFSETYKFKELDDIQNLLDEHIVLTQSMRASPYVKEPEIEMHVIGWEKKLIIVQETLDEWIKCQNEYCYLEPIFYKSKDISSQLPNESILFANIDKMWKGVMEMTNKTKYVMQVVLIENLKENFLKSNKILEDLHNKLRAYLETKRKAFPRFYFLSEDSLLKILSDTKDPLRVQEHLKQLFEGIDVLNFTQNLEIVAMESKQKEHIDFIRKVVPLDSQGKVEIWLTEVEKVMMSTIRDVIMKAMKNYTINPRTKWIKEWPGQVVLCVSQSYWTLEVEQSIKSQGKKGIEKYFSRLTKQMNDLIELVRGSLTSLERITLGALVIMDVHAKDVVNNLIKENVNEITDFEWLNQLRYYWETNSSTQEGFNNGELSVKQVTATIKYGYEYLGNTGRLVITPLTDRCNRTLMGALQLNRGGAPEGPAGTGKTETAKDLAKAVAKFCIVFNCSDEIKYEDMAKFFKGLSASGAWSCFDEFNRIELEVLSVIAQQIQIIQKALMSKEKMFFFEGSDIELKSCAIFITMNPGYAGRSELPDNLKALFRTVAMMIPDYSLISEIKLFSYGFFEGRNLARKIVATYKLCSEQLSRQRHYDYGMRAVIAVLDRAGSLKREFPTTNEDELMLRAITDVNLPKFLTDDVILFNGIISDLFPDIIVKPPDYSLLTQCLQFQCKKYNLQPIEVFFKKIIQLYEMIIVRHGLMIVGNSFSGKTVSYRILSESLKKMHFENNIEKDVYLFVLNPKSISMQQLYGFTTVTKEWRDGILPQTFRAFLKIDPKKRKWLIFDGPVDTLWIESMNTVLDDTKKLCLPNSETIPMSDSMNLIFEVQDLAVASPATVSRCGMVFMEPNDLGWRPILNSWLEALPNSIKDSPELFEVIKKFIEIFLEPLLITVKKSCKQYIKTSDILLIRSFLDIFDSLIEDFKDEKKIENINPKAKISKIEGIFIFSLIWSIGGTIDSEGRILFDKKIKDIINLVDKKNHKFTIKIPEKNNFYEYLFDIEKLEWIKWIDLIKTKDIPQDTQFQNIIVPTLDTVRYTYLLDVLIKSQKKILFVGPTGTGKTVYIKQKLLNGLDRNLFIPIFLTFSARTKASQTQDLIQLKLEKRKRGYIGAPVGKKSIIFIDDLSLPQIESSGAQPPIELLRQYIDHGGWYDFSAKEVKFINVIDIQLIGAIGTVGSSKNSVSDRFLRHFNIISLTPFNDETLGDIFETILNWYLKDSALFSISKKVIESSINLFHDIISSFKPTPEKSHYTFNLRDLSKVFQGILSVKKKKLTDKSSFLKLWSHEFTRVFHDRLINDENRKEFFSLLKKQLNEISNMKESKEKEEEIIIYGDFMEPVHELREYEELKNFDEVKRVMNNYLEEYNNNNSKDTLNIVLFKFAIEHITRISRIIKQPYGNALLVGVGGSGRQSLTKLATFIADYKLFKISLTKLYSLDNWKDDMKKLLIQTGIHDLDTVFLFSDSQIKDEKFLEDISSLLNTGEIPNLFEEEEMKEIIENLRKIAKQLGKDQSIPNLLNLFTERSRNRLHLVICMSPVGENFRNYIRVFPSLVNCTTIDWFSKWPSDALFSVAKSFVDNLSIEINEEIKIKISEIFVTFHNSVQDLSKEYLENMKRFNYVTPTKYLDLLQNFEILYSRKKIEVETKKKRYETGLKKIYETEENVKNMQKKLEELQPELKRLAKQNDTLTKEIEIEKKEANQKKILVEAEEKELNKLNEENLRVKRECQMQLDKALPVLQQAKEDVKKIKKQDIEFIKSLPNPPQYVKLVMKGVCLVKNIKGESISIGIGKTTLDFWKPSQKMMAQSGFLNSIIDFDIETDMNDEIEKRLIPLLEQDDWKNEDAIKNASEAAFALYKWVNALLDCHQISKEVRPKQIALEKAVEQYKESMKQLNSKKKELNDLQEKISNLEKKHENCKDEKQKLDVEFERVSIELDRAKKIIGYLSGEKGRWAESIEILEENIKTIVGDSLLSTGIVSYLGAFINEYREKIINDWKEKLRETGILCTENYSVDKFLSNNIEINEWKLQGLPSDNFSICNAIITKNSRRFSLFIDPQRQASIWIKKKEKNYVILKINDSNLIKSLERAISDGKVVIIEGLGEELDPALNPLLNKQTYKIGNISYLKLSDNPVQFNEDFKLYLVTNLSNPHYLPEDSAKVVLINFMITPDGLKDQLLGDVFELEEAELENEKNEILIKSAESIATLVKIEDDMLILLEEVKQILKDEKAIVVLANSKKTSDKVKIEQQAQIKNSERIDLNRNKYIPVAEDGSILFFSICDLAQIDPMYQYSLRWFKDLFKLNIKRTQTEKKNYTEEDIQKRIKQLIETFRLLLFENVCRSLFEKDKILLPFLISIKIKQYRKEIDYDEWRFLLTGGISTDDSIKNPAKDWISEQTWREICNLSNLKNFNEFYVHIEKNLSEWKKIYYSNDPQKLNFPGKWNDLDKFQKLLIIRVIRPDKLIPSIENFIVENLGQKFIEPPIFDISVCYNDSSNVRPLIFILSPGVDPMDSIWKFSEKKKCVLDYLSLGQGQGPKAAEKIKNAILRGTWIVLQNCHLCESWMPYLEKITDDFSETMSNSFRLWLTSKPTKKFPVSILQNSIKITNEQPKGIKANLKRSFASDPITNEDFFENNKKKNDFKKLLFGLTFFHAVVQERRRFGALGWNILYEFNESDMKISLLQLQMFLNENKDIPFKALLYLTGECNYGGRVTDEHDRKCLNAILSDFYTEKIIKDDYSFSPSKIYYSIKPGSINDYLNYINNLPISQSPEIFGMDNNADITKDKATAMVLFSSILLTQEKSNTGKGARSSESIVEEQSKEILKKLPKNFNMEEILKKYPIKYEEVMNTVLIQEILRYNILLSTIRDTLENVLKALKGEILMTEDYEKLSNSIYNGAIPDMWKGNSYPSILSLGAYFSDLLKRINFFINWIEQGIPVIFWLPGFFFTQCFLTGIKQKFSRDKKIAIDKVLFNFKVMSKTPKISPTIGCYINGCLIEGASWNDEKQQIVDSEPKKLFAELPPIFLNPSETEEFFSHYECPVYKTLERRGELSTTGHSTNFVMEIKLPTEKEPKYFIKRGCAIILNV